MLTGGGNTSRLVSRSRREEENLSRIVKEEPLSVEERSAVDAYVQYRLKLAAHPLAVGGRGGASVQPFSAAIRDLSDKVLQAEAELIAGHLADVEDDIKDGLIEQESLRFGIMRLRETLAVGRMKIAATHTYLDKAKEVIFEAAKRGLPSPTSVMDVAPDLILRRARLQDALSAATDVCPTVVYPTLLESISAAVQARRKVEYEKKWADEVREESTAVEQQMSSLMDKASTADEDVRLAKAMLDDAHRDVFTKRKKYIVTHKRLTGLERLPDGTLLSPAQTVSLIARIKVELRQGVTTTLDRLADTDCEELMTASKATDVGAKSSVRSTAAASSNSPAVSFTRRPVTVPEGASSSSRPATPSLFATPDYRIVGR